MGLQMEGKEGESYLTTSVISRQRALLFFSSKRNDDFTSYMHELITKINNDENACRNAVNYMTSLAHALLAKLAPAMSHVSSSQRRCSIDTLLSLGDAVSVATATANTIAIRRSRVSLSIFRYHTGFCKSNAS